MLTFMTHAFALDRPRISGQHCRGVCVAARLLLILVGLKRTWIGSCPLGLMSSQLNVVTTGLLFAHIHDHLLLPVPQCRYRAVSLETDTDVHLLMALLVDHPDVLMDQRRECSCGAIIDIHAYEFYSPEEATCGAVSTR